MSVADTSLAVPAEDGSAKRKESGARELLMRLAGAAALIGSVALSLWLVLAATARPSQLSPRAIDAHFAPWIVGPLGHLMSGLHATPVELRSDRFHVLVGLFICWLVAAYCARSLPLWAVGAALGLLGLIFLLSPPMALTDLFNYLHYGRMGALHGLNPYQDLPFTARHDPSWQLTNWRHLLSPYGPLFTLVTYFLALLPYHAAYWAWKLIVMLSAFGVLALVAWIAPHVGRSPQRAVAFVGLNPLVLVFGLGGQHNDPLMLVVVLAAVALVIRGSQPAADRGWSIGAGAAAVAAAGVKLSAIALAPLVIVATPRRRSALAGAAAAAVVVALVILIAFGGYLPNAVAQDRLVGSFSVPQILGWIGGQGGETEFVHTLANVIFALSVIVATVVVWSRPAWFIGACGSVMLVAILTLGWTMPWYVWWVLPFAALARTRWLAGFCVLLTIWLAIGAIPEGARVTSAVGYKPWTTPAGKAHVIYTRSLLR